jgi:hypothetical protein
VTKVDSRDFHVTFLMRLVFFAPLEAKSGLLGFVELSSMGKHVGVGMKTSFSGCSFAELVRATTSYAASFGGGEDAAVGSSRYVSSGGML